MPQKIRQLKAALAKAGFSVRPGKGSHTVWQYPELPSTTVTIAGKDGKDAQGYSTRPRKPRPLKAGMNGSSLFGA